MSPGAHAGITSAHFIKYRQYMRNAYYVLRTALKDKIYLPCLCNHSYSPLPIAHGLLYYPVSGTQTRLYGVVHIVISEQAAPPCKVKVPEGAQITVNNLTLFCIADFKKRVCVLYPHNSTAQNLVSLDKPYLLKPPNCNIAKLLVRGFPDVVSLETEVFSHEDSLSLRSHLLAPVRRLVNSAERYLLFRNINPGLVGGPFSIDHNRDNNKVP